MFNIKETLIEWGHPEVINQSVQVRESRQMSERQEAQLTRERGKSRELQRQLEEVRETKEETIASLTSQLLEAKKTAARGNKERSRWGIPSHSSIHYYHT